MKKIISVSLTLVLAITSLNSCKKSSDPTPPVDATLNGQVISEFSVNVASAEYMILKTKTALLYTQVQALAADRTDENLAACRTTWKEARQIWEQSEAQLFGPVETDNIDPRIDTWPVNFADLDAELNNENAFTEEYINNLEDALKGFHPIEYLIFGQGGNKVAEDLTDRQIEYLTALALNLKTLTANLADEWVTTSTTNFYATFIAAGSGSSLYPTQKSALEQLVNAMSAICDEVANGKIAEPYDQQDPQLEESPFSGNSMIDFTNNITGIQNVYTGKYQTDGTGLEDVVKKYNLSLDSKIKSKLAAAITAMGNVTLPFGEAILQQHVQVESAMSAINDLKTTLDEELLPFVRLHAE